MSAEEYREHAWACERVARSLSSANAPLRETMREVAAQWRRLAEDAEAEAPFQKIAVTIQSDPLPAFLTPLGRSVDEEDR